MTFCLTFSLNSYISAQSINVFLSVFILDKKGKSDLEKTPKEVATSKLKWGSSLKDPFK